MSIKHHRQNPLECSISYVSTEDDETCYTKRNKQNYNGYRIGFNGENLNSVSREASRHFREVKESILNTKLIIFQQAIKELEHYIKK
jgi:hypothetical protein